MLDIFSGWPPIFVVLFFTAPIVVVAVLVGHIVGLYHSTQMAKEENTLKREMIEKGMPINDILRILNPYGEQPAGQPGDPNSEGEEDSGSTHQAAIAILAEALAACEMDATEMEEIITLAASQDDATLNQLASTATRLSDTGASSDQVAAVLRGILNSRTESCEEEATNEDESYEEYEDEEDEDEESEDEAPITLLAATLTACDMDAYRMEEIITLASRHEDAMLNQLVSTASRMADSGASGDQIAAVLRGLLNGRNQQMRQEEHSKDPTETMEPLPDIMLERR